MKKSELIFIMILICYLAFSAVNYKKFDSDYKSLQNDVVRIHILANSDDEEDQALKLRVRDRVLEHTDGWLNDVKNTAEAELLLSSRMDEINSIAQDMVYECGYDYPVSSEFVDMEFDDRVYGDITMPHGMYRAVRITIGEAAGHNWWCVMYPPLCIPAAGGELDIDDYSEYFTDGQINIMKHSGKYRIKFKIAEIIEYLKNISKKA